MRLYQGSALCGALAPLLLAVVIAAACSGTETDNPIAGSSPSDFTPLIPPPPCDPLEGPQQPSGRLAITLPSAGAQIIAVADRSSGLRVVDVSDAQNPVTLSVGAVRGEIHELLLSSAGQLWVAATEPPLVSGSALPSGSALDDELHLVELDVSNPAAPLRIAQTNLAASYWQMREHDGAIWVLSMRAEAAAPRCDVPFRWCGPFPRYAAVELQGFAASGSELTPLASAELPFDLRAYFRDGGVVTVLQDQSLHALGWDATGALAAARDYQLPDAEPVGALDLEDGKLRVVGVSSGQATLHAYDLSATSDAPARSSDLGPLPNPDGEFALVFGDKVWMPGTFYRGTAQLWDLSGATPELLTLPLPYADLLPIEGATLDGVSGQLAVGWQVDEQGQPSLHLVSVDGQTVTELALIPGRLDLSPGASIAAPDGLVGNGSARLWNIAVRGLGLPLDLDPAVPARAIEGVVASAAVLAGGASGSFTDLVRADLAYEGPDAGLALELTRGDRVVRLPAPLGAEGLVPIPHGVLVTSTSESACDSGVNCTGVALFDLTSQPRLSARLPLPVVPVPGLGDTNRAQVSWDIDGPLGFGVRPALPLASGLAFVADVRLICHDAKTCADVGIQPLSLAEAHVIPSTPACPLGDPMCSVAASATPDLYGTAQRKYLYALRLDADSAMAWQTLGMSRLESTQGGDSSDFSRFGEVVAAGDTVGVTRLERVGSDGQRLPRGQYRFMFDRFRLDASGAARALSPLHVLGYPLVRFTQSTEEERWLSAEPTPAQTGEAVLHLLRLTPSVAGLESTLTLAGQFINLLPLTLPSGETVALALGGPADTCGPNTLSAIRMIQSTQLELTSTLELPSDGGRSTGWGIVALDGARAVFERGNVYALIELDAHAQLHVVSVRASDGLTSAQQLLGRTLFTAGTSGGRIEF